MSFIIDSYSESNQDTYTELYGTNLGNRGDGESFTNTTASVLDSCKFHLCKSGSPTGYAVAKIYDHTGVFGTSSKPGTLLATSDNFDVSALTTSFQLISFNFLNANLIHLTAATNYIVTIEYSGGSTNDRVCVGLDTISPTASGNRTFKMYDNTWGAVVRHDVCFYVYGYTPSPLPTFFR